MENERPAYDPIPSIWNVTTGLSISSETGISAWTLILTSKAISRVILISSSSVLDLDFDSGWHSDYGFGWCSSVPFLVPLLDL